MAVTSFYLSIFEQLHIGIRGFETGKLRHLGPIASVTRIVNCIHNGFFAFYIILISKLKLQI